MGCFFAGRYAIVDLSQVRENRTFQGLPLDQALKRNEVPARNGLLIIDTASGDTGGCAGIEGVVRELYDAAVPPGIRTPSVPGCKTNEIIRVITIAEWEPHSKPSQIDLI